MSDVSEIARDVRNPKAHNPVLPERAGRMAKTFVYHERTPRLAITQGLARLHAIYPLSQALQDLDPDFLDGYDGLGPFQIPQQVITGQEAQWQVRMKACEYLIVAYDGIRDYATAQLALDPEFDASPLTALADQLEAIADEAYHAIKSPGMM